MTLCCAFVCFEEVRRGSLLYCRQKHFTCENLFEARRVHVCVASCLPQARVTQNCTVAFVGAHYRSQLHAVESPEHNVHFSVAKSTIVLTRVLLSEYP